MPYNPKRTGTKTSAFGSPGRVNHDSTPFYASKLYEGLPKEEITEYVENPIPPNLWTKSFASPARKWKKYQTIAFI
jgi:hypothetical protein